MDWTLFLIGAAAGGFINGLAGFGAALFALGFWLQIMEPVEAVAVVAAMSAITGLQGVWTVRAAIQSGARRLTFFLLPAILGIPLGVAALSVIDATSLKLVIGGVMLLYGGFFMFRRTLPNLSGERPVVDASVGFLGGVAGGAASLSGALPTMWCAMRGWPKAETRAVLQPFNVAVLGLTTLFFAARGVYAGETLLLLGVALIASLLAAQIGLFVFHRLPDAAFRRLLIAMMLLSGLTLVGREVF